MKRVEPVEVGMCAERLERIGEHLRSRYVEPGKIPGSLTLVARRGQVCYLEKEGSRDLERDLPVEEDTIFRIYSMTKPITSIALMQLYERGLFHLNDPVHRFIPEWRDLRVYKAGSWPMYETVACQQPMTVRQLFTHMSGLTYGFLHATNVDHGYRKARIGSLQPGQTLRDLIEGLATLPLEFEPGTAWNYSVATDVLGYLVEVLSGQSFDEYLEEHIFEPLNMHDTAFNIADDKVARFASCYQRNLDKSLALEDDGQASAYRDRSFFSGGGGLVSTMADYYRFCSMLRGGGELDGARIIGPRTLAMMTANHLPDGGDLAGWARGSFSETSYDGIGFGLGFATRLDPVANGTLGSVGEYNWGGLASTLFWVDPAEDLVVIFMTQLIPSGTFDFRGQLQSIVYSSIVD